MIFIERIPRAPLNEHVRLLWYTQAPHVPHQRERVLPTGCVQVILSLARDFLLECTENKPERPLAPALVVGARSMYEVIHSSDMAELMGVVFYPGGFGPFACGSVDVFSNQSVSLEDVWGTSARSLRDDLREVPAIEAKLSVLEDFLLQRFAARFFRNRLVEFALSRFGRLAGVSAVNDVAKETGWSVRHFSQCFREQVGLSPKVWCRVQRFQRAVRELHAGADIRWAELAIECGYYDQSHFANEFRSFSGIDATTYSVRRTQWANHIAEQ